MVGRERLTAVRLRPWKLGGKPTEKRRGRGGVRESDATEEGRARGEGERRRDEPGG